MRSFALAAAIVVFPAAALAQAEPQRFASESDASPQEAAPPAGAREEPPADPTLSEDPYAAEFAGLEEAPPIKDPWEGFNRKMYAFNRVIDRYALAPAATAYVKVTPRPLRRGISNALSNVSSPVTIGNEVLQGRFKRAGVTIARLAVNSTVGIGGFIDVGSKIGLKRNQEDFGQTLGAWGAPSGPYLFLPFFGPSSVRDAFAQPVDVAMDPLTWTQFQGFRALRWSRVGVGALDARAGALRGLAELENMSPDPYVTIRTLYALSRRNAIANGAVAADDLPDFGDPMSDVPFEDTPPAEVPPSEAAPPIDHQDQEPGTGPALAWLEPAAIALVTVEAVDPAL